MNPSNKIISCDYWQLTQILLYLVCNGTKLIIICIVSTCRCKSYCSTRCFVFLFETGMVGLNFAAPADFANLDKYCSLLMRPDARPAASEGTCFDGELWLGCLEIDLILASLSSLCFFSGQQHQDPLQRTPRTSLKPPCFDLWLSWSLSRCVYYRQTNQHIQGHLDRKSVV